ncbi:MAG: DUF6055 domain-containing protein [Pseudomonadota bacterium]|nr:DUF6055 domain-containing protein [Pseudomonadota bacterium]
MLLSLLPLALPLALAGTAPGLGSVRPPCGTPAAAATFGPPPFLPMPPPDGDEEKEERDAYGDFANELESDNFLIKWGRSGSVDEDAAERLLAAFENAWAVEVEQMGHPAPAGTEAYLFNVYIGDTGDDSPDGYGASGYYNRDPDGFPMIVVSVETLADEDWATGTATHEFYHAIQDSTGRYEYSGESAWYWEATAMWIEGEVLPDHDDYVAFLFGYGLLPHLPVYFFDYPDTGALQEYHQYGAMIFPRYVSEIAADWEVVRDTWIADIDAETPQDALEVLLAERGIDFADAFGDFASRNATWDYADGELYTQWMEWYADYYSADDHSVVAEVERTGTGGVVSAPEATLPGRYAYNVVTLPRPSDDDLLVRFEGGAGGDKGSPAEWRVTVVRERDEGGPEYVRLSLVDGAGEVLLEGVGDEQIHLVAASVAREARTDEVFAWSYAMTPTARGEPDPEPIDTDGDTDALDPEPVGMELRACGCTSGAAGGNAAGLLVLAGLATLGRRRR